MVDRKLRDVWYRMHANSRSEAYRALGIKVCLEWSDDAKFMEWARQAGYQPGMWFRRIDKAGNFEPGNCRFEPRKVTPSLISIVKQAKAAGESLDAIASKTGLSKPTICNIAAGRWGKSTNA